MSYLEQIHERARVASPERWAPNGEALAGYPGASWEERRVAWEVTQRMAAARASADEEPEIPSAVTSDGPPDPEEPEDQDDQDAPYGRARGEA